MSSGHAQCSTIIPVGDAPDVDERPRQGTPRRGRIGEQRHRRLSMGAVQSEVLRHDIAVTDEVVLFEGDRPEIVVDGAQDRASPLRP